MSSELDLVVNLRRMKAKWRPDLVWTGGGHGITMPKGGEGPPTRSRVEEVRGRTIEELNEESQQLYRAMGSERPQRAAPTPPPSDIVEKGRRRTIRAGRAAEQRTRDFAAAALAVADEAARRSMSSEALRALARKLNKWIELVGHPLSNERLLEASAALPAAMDEADAVAAKLEAEAAKAGAKTKGGTCPSDSAQHLLCQIPASTERPLTSAVALAERLAVRKIPAQDDSSIRRHLRELRDDFGLVTKNKKQIRRTAAGDSWVRKMASG